MTENANTHKLLQENVTKIWGELYNEYSFFSRQLLEYDGQDTVMLIVDLDKMGCPTLMTEDKIAIPDVIMDEAIRSIVETPRFAIKAISSFVREEKPSIKDVSVVIKGFTTYTSIKRKLREIRSHNLNQGVIFDGIIRNSTPVIARLKSMAYHCPVCGQTGYFEQDGDFETEFPDSCPLCNELSALQRMEDSDIITDYIECEIEEEPEGLGGKQPERVTCRVTGELTQERLRNVAGDRCTFFGVYRLKKKDKKSLIYDKYIDIIGAEKKGKQYEEIEISEEDKKEFEEMSKSPTLLQDMSSCIAPNIYGYDIEKKAILLQLFGGNQYSERRGDIHILIVGEPGIGKSSMIKTISKIAPLVVKASGSMTTTVGLGACISRDDEKAGGFVVEAGACVLASGGIIIIDEFDKMDEKTRGSMHEIMEDQVVTVAKANINTQLIAECSVLAIMNPKNNRFEKDVKTSEQINLLPSLLSRFDLVFALKDDVNEAKDTKIIEAIDRARDGDEIKYIYKPDMVMKYIQYARNKIGGLKKNDEAKAALSKKYIEIRQSNKDSEAVAITSRQYEGISRLAEAHAKMRLSSVIELQDAEAALKIMEYYLKTMCLDPGTGKICIDSVNGGKVPSERSRDSSLLEILVEMRNEIALEHPDMLPASCLIDVEAAKDAYIVCGHTDKEFDKARKSLYDDNKITMQRGDSKIKVEREK